MARLDPHKAGVIVADAFGAAHFFIANIILVLGRSTDWFNFVGKPNPGFYWVVEYLDAPVYWALKPFFQMGDEFSQYFLFAEIVFILSSLLYGLLVYAAVRGYIAFFVVGKR